MSVIPVNPVPRIIDDANKYTIRHTF